MILLEPTARGTHSGHSCLLLGLGLIGSAVREALLSGGYRIESEYPSHWDDRVARIETFDGICRQLQESGSVQKSFHVVWTAGSGSFAASETDLLIEREAFDDMFGMARSIHNLVPTTIHFVSSAGALFEGLRNVDANSEPNPRSPYGQMKSDQEARLTHAHHEGRVQTKIYRPSTVYGSHEFHRRAGLVSHVMWNALRAIPTTLEANIHGLRDYVYYKDVGKFIAGQVNANQDHDRLFYLASAKPSSIFEIFHRIERLMGQSLFYQLTPTGTNSADITFSDRLLPPLWRPTPLEVGLSDVWRETRKSFLAEQHQIND